MSQPTPNQNPPPKPQEKPKNHKKSKQKHKNTTTNNNKRLQVTDSSGWTHVTTTSRARRIPPPTKNTTKTTASTTTNTDTDTDTKESLQPAEPPQDLTLSALEAQFRKHYERWQDSESWVVVRGAISSLSPPPTNTNTNTHNPEESDTTRTENNGQIQSIISIGLGSPSGFLRGGWVDRRQVSMDQLAALVSIKELLGNVKTYAQDPVFNTLDAALLHSLGISVVEHPVAFERVSKDSFLFCPGVERVHLDALLRGEKPRALFGGPLEEMEESSAVQGFLDGKAVTKVPLFETNEKAFWGMKVYV